MPTRTPIATYRLQLNRYFTLNDVLQLVPYFDSLGISDLYCSPLLKSVAGSMHGYDVVDYTQLNPEIGSEYDLERLAAALHERGMGLLLDFVPNHMCICSENQWWQDVLENGPSSRYAHHFNIVWSPYHSSLKNKVLLPVLERGLREALVNHDITIVCIDSLLFFSYRGEKFPVNPSNWLKIIKPAAESFVHKNEGRQWSQKINDFLLELEHLPNFDEVEGQKAIERLKSVVRIKKFFKEILECIPEFSLELKQFLKNMNFQSDLLEQLLENQAYVLSDWKLAQDNLNYRRFFDISNLITMQTENPAVFQDIHAHVLNYVRKGWITGLRIDHVDGLYDPEGYLTLLQDSCSDALQIRDLDSTRPFFIVVEKILEGDETLSENWPVFGTTGYDYLNQVNALCVQQENREIFHKLYEHFVGKRRELSEEIYASKKYVLKHSMASSFNLLEALLREIYESEIAASDFSFEELSYGLQEVLACFPVYRSYIRPETNVVENDDRKWIEESILQAKLLHALKNEPIFDYIKSLLLLDNANGLTTEQMKRRKDFVMRFQQLTGPVAAKGIEDTALYRVFPLASLNEVGADLKSFGISICSFHDLNLRRLAAWPYSLIATSTHDNKRSEDVRARLNVLSEVPDLWFNAVERWSRINDPLKAIEKGRAIPDRLEEYLLYQALVGSWPCEIMNPAEQEKYTERLVGYMMKALREAKIHSSWSCTNERYEASIREYIHKLLKPAPDNRFLDDFTQFIKPIALAGMWNSLVQIFLKMTSPGVPDCYQGNELWEFSLVDPDNRHLVEYQKRNAFLEEIKAAQNSICLIRELLKTMEDGRIKLFLTLKVLNFRKEHALLFHTGQYIPIHGTGEDKNRLIAYSMIHNKKAVIAITSRFFFQSKKNTPENFENVYLELPLELAGNYRDILTGQLIETTKDLDLPLPSFFSSFPLLLLDRIKH